MKLILKIGIVFLKLIYAVIKLFPTKNKIVFLSRQSNNPNTDFLLLKEEIIKENKRLKIVMLCKTIDKGLLGKIKYIFHMFKQMYHIATSKVAILDSYCIVISLLNHKKSLKVIQIWHAMGSLKKFGFSIIGKEEGSKKEIAELLKMHNNYDYVLCSSKSCINPFKEAFNVNEEKMIVQPLPRVDLIMDEKHQKDVKNKIFKKHPILKEKKNILYAPTFRKNHNDLNRIEELIKNVNLDKYNLIIKPHPLVKNITINTDKVILDSSISTIDFSYVADYIITDYSAIVFEISLLNKPMYFWTYDFDNYVNGRDFYLDYKNEMPGIVEKDIKQILKKIDKNDYDTKKISNFCKKYISNTSNNTKCLTKFILNLMK